MTIEDLDLHLARNVATRDRLVQIAGRMRPEDLDRPLGEGWTIATAFVHLAYWDRRALGVIRRYLAGAELGVGAPPALADSSAVASEAIAYLARYVDPAGVRQLVTESASAVDQALNGAPPARLLPLIDGPHAWLVRRYGHRDEHLEQIEQALA